MFLNNGDNLVKKLEEESFLEEFAVGRLDENGVLESPSITDSNIKHNSIFITDLFECNQNADNKVLSLKTPRR